jgi:signal transduction histidine kinase/CheY-like chemotaxis protein
MMQQESEPQAWRSRAIGDILRDFQRELLPPIWGVLCALALVLVLYDAGVRDLTQRHTLALLLVMVPSLSLWMDHQVGYLAGVWALVVGCLALNVVVLRYWQIEEAVSLLVLPTGLAALMIGRPAGVVTAILTTIALFPSPALGPLPSSGYTVGALAGVWGALLLSSGFVHLIHIVGTWSWEHYERARRLLDRARDRYVRSMEVQDDLEDANLQLARLHERLRATYRVAEEARSAKEQFVANVSHELRTPLNMIIGFSEMIVQSPQAYGGSLPQSLLADIAVIHRNSQHLASLVEDVLDLSQIEAGRMALTKERSSLREIIQEAALAVRPLFESKGLYLETVVPEDLPLVLCDRTRIRQVVLNLLSNAGRFTERGGVRVRARQDDGRIVTEVADTGPGIAPESQERVFEPFRQAEDSTYQRHGGRGLGLTISRKFVEMHDGEMWLESEAGAGTTFYFSLPVEALPPLGEGVARWFSPYLRYEARTRPSLAPKPEIVPRYVVLEQGDAVHRMLDRYLGGAEVVPVHDFEEAVGELRRSPAQALVLNDASQGQGLMPPGLLARLPHNTPVVTCRVPTKEDRWKELGAVDYLVKPVERATLLQSLENLGGQIETILLADDEPEALQLFGRMLISANRGYRVLRASNGQQALSLLHRRRPDAVLLDLFMPDMDGFQVLARKNRDAQVKDIPVIVISAKDPLDEPITSGTLTATRNGGLSVYEVVSCIQAIGQILTPSSTSADRVSRERPVE